MVVLTLEHVDELKTGPAVEVKTQPSGIDHGVLRRQHVWGRHQFASGVGQLGPLHEVIEDIVFDAAQVLKNSRPSPAGEVVVSGQHQVIGVGAAVVGVLRDPLAARGHSQVGVQKGPDVQIVALAVALVGQIGLFVVFKAVDPAVVVLVDAVEEFRPVGVEAQERLFVVGHPVGA